MAKTSEVFGKIITKELLLESRNGNVKITIDEEGSLVLGADIDSSNGSFKISPSNNSLQIPEIKFTDGTSITSISYLEIQQNSIKGKDAYNNFNWPSSKLKDTVLSDSVVGDLGKARDVYSKFDWNSSRLKDESLSDSVSGSLEKARNAYDRFNWPSGKLKDDYLSDTVKTDISRGVNTYDRFDWPNGILKDDFLSEFLKNRITKGFEAYDRFDWPLGKLNDNNLSDLIKDRITKGVNAFDTFGPKFGSDGFLKDDFVSVFLKDRITKGVNAFDTFGPKFGSDGFLKDDFVSVFLKDRITKGVTAEGKFGSDGKLLDFNLRDGLLNNINLGVSSYNDLGSLDFSFDNSNPNIPVIKLSRGSRGNSSSSFSKSSIGLANVENKSSATIRGETFADTIFTAVQNNASSAVSTANTANSNASSALTNATSALTAANNAKSTADTIEGRFTSGLLNEANAAASLRNSNLSFTQGSDGTITLNRGSGLASITTNPLSTSTFTTLQSTADTANSNASTALTNASTALTTANTAKSTADTVNGRFDANGKLKLANLTKGTINTSLNFLRNGTSTNFFSGNPSAQTQPEVVIEDSIQVKSIITTNPAGYAENYLNGRTYIKSLYAIDNSVDIGVPPGPPIKDIVANQLIINTSLAVVNSLGATSGLVQVPKLVVNAGATATTTDGDLVIKQSSDANSTATGLALSRPGTTDNWNIYTNLGNSLTFNFNNTSKGRLDSSIDQGVIDFTGQHRNIPEDDIDSYENKIGLIVVSTGKYDLISINESLPYVKLSSFRNQKSVFGVISNKEEINSTTREYQQGVFVSILTKQNNEDDTKLIINSVGEGAIWVCNINGNLENGDYITTCEIPGFGMKQDSDNLKNYTVAKITCDCDFNLNSSTYKCEEFEFSGSIYRKAFVGCTYHCG